MPGHLKRPTGVALEPEVGAPSSVAEPAGPRRSARSLSTATGASFALRLVGVGIGMITTALLARYLSPDGYGVLALAMTLTAAAGQVADMGLAVTVAARVATAGPSAGSVLGTGLAMRTIVALAAMIGLIVAAVAGVFGASGAVIGVVALATPLSAAAVLTAGSTARFRPEISSLLAVTQALLWLVAVVAVARTDRSIGVLAWAFVLVVLLQTGLGVAMNRRIVPLGRPAVAHARTLLALSWPLAISSVAVMAYYRLDSVILFSARGPSEVGYYSAAYKFLDVAQILPAAVVAPLLALGATSAAKSDLYRKALLSLATRAGALAGIVTAVGLAVLADPLIAWLYGTEFRPAVIPLRLLGVAFFGVSLGYVGTTLCSAVGKVRALAVLTSLTAVVSLTVHAWAAPRWGAVGAAAVTAVTELVIGASTCLLAARAMRSVLPLASLGGIVAVGAGVITVTAVLHVDWWIESGLAALLLSSGLLLSRAVTPADLRRILSRRAL